MVAKMSRETRIFAVRDVEVDGHWSSSPHPNESVGGATAAAARA